LLSDSQLTAAWLPAEDRGQKHIYSAPYIMLNLAKSHFIHHILCAKIPLLFGIAKLFEEKSSEDQLLSGGLSSDHPLRLLT
jgi:hypothetical protein